MTRQPVICAPRCLPGHAVPSEHRHTMRYADGIILAIGACLVAGVLIGSLTGLPLAGTVAVLSLAAVGFIGHALFATAGG